MARPMSVNPGVLPLKYATTAYAASGVVKNSGPARLLSLAGYNSKGAAQFIHIFDAAAVPADTTVPNAIIYVTATTNFSFDFGSDWGMKMDSGICWSNSSTGPTKTIGSADCFVYAIYE